MSDFRQPVIASVLVAARNEEANILRCLQSLHELDYPVENVEIWIGDDDSSDLTADIVQNFIRDKPHFRYFKIAPDQSGLKGKARVLAQLARKAAGEYFFFCDADIAVKPTWIKAMLAQFKPDTGVAVGLTRMKRSHLLADFLSLEWLFALTIMKICALFKVPVTALGNNMAVTRKAYECVGGYEKIGFSIVEDYALFTAIVAHGSGFTQCYTKDVLSFSEPANSFRELSQQRRRWMQGVMESHWLTKLIIILAACTIPALITLAIWHPALAAVWLFIHYGVTTLTAIFSIIVLGQKDLWKTVFIFWFYLFIHTTIMLINFFRPGRLIWKDREY